jgi:hypothetical protein
MVDDKAGIIRVSIGLQFNPIKSTTLGDLIMCTEIGRISLIKDL